MRSAVFVAAFVLLTLSCPACDGLGNRTASGSKGGKSSKASSSPIDLNKLLLISTGSAALGIVLTVSCVVLIMSGKCSGDPFEASAGRPRGFDGFKTLPFVPKKLFERKKPADKKGSAPASKAASAVSLQDNAPSKMNVADEKTAEAAKKSSAIPLGPKSSGVDRRTSLESTSDVEGSVVSMSQSAVSMSEASGVGMDNMSEVSESQVF